MEFTVGREGFGFKVEEVSDIPEIGGKAIVMTHVLSGAKLLYLANDDVNKAFSISFKTPPVDDTGVFHILEHSVLCGSRKFPVKEPFVNLLKGSMQTFLNAMTFQDKTMYPVASTNERDLMNLMDVYLDAVLRPNIYQKETIFQQEGWHFECTGEGGEQAPRGLAYNGVVYNEMKGALSEPESVLYNAVCAQLFPDTAYRFESGGAPASIPGLTYEQFLRTHANHYRLDNSYLLLYGNLDASKFLAFLDQEYLTPCADLNKDSAGPNELALQEPVSSFGNKIAMATAPDNSCMALGYVVGRAHEDVRIYAADILLDAIAGSNESPLRRALIDADLADDVSAFLADGTLQPFAVLQLRGLREGASERFQTVVNEAVRQLAGMDPDPSLGMSVGPLDHEIVEAAISHAEFVMRERSFGVADGVAFAMSSMAGWLYDDDGATRYLRYDDTFKFLRQQLGTRYFEDLLISLFLENPHAAGVELVPVDQEGETDEALRLAQIAQGLAPEDFQRIDEQVERLRAAQEREDTPEELATLPHLGVKDIDPAPAEPAFELDDEGAVPVIHHHVDSHGIIYAYRYYDLDLVSFDELPYVTILANVLGKLDTARHTAAQLDTMCQAKLGSLSFFTEIHANVDDASLLFPKFVVGASALPENAPHMASLPAEVMHETRFDDVDKIRDILVQRRVGMEQAFVNAGHSVAMGRVASYYSPAAAMRQKQAGIDFYLFLKDLLDNFDDRSAALVDMLGELAARIFGANRCVVGFTGTDDDLARYRRDCAASNLDRPLPSAAAAAPADGTDATAAAAAAPADGAAADGTQAMPEKRLTIPEPKPLNEAFIVPSDVTFCALGYDRDKLGGHHEGSWLLASKALSLDYLWNEVRVKGGAYGCGFQVLIGGNMRFYSYRDPRLDQTVQRFRDAAEWLAGFDPEDEELEGYIVSTVSGMDAPAKPRGIARKQDGWFFGGYDPAKKAVTRQEVIDATAQQLRDKAGVVREMLAKDYRCVVGNKDAIRSSELQWDIIELLG